MDAVEIAELYKRFGPLVYRRCRKLLVDPEQARDASQEVFVRAMRHAEKLVFDRECLPWLYRVSTNYCLNLIRDRKKVRHVPLSAIKEHGAGTEIEQQLTVKEQIGQVLNRFDETASQIAVLAHVDQLTQEEIASVTGLSRRTVGKRLKQIAEAGSLWRDEEEA